MEGPVWKRAAGLMSLSAGLLLSGCAVGPKYQRPNVEAPPAYKEVGNWKTAAPNEQKLGGNWWEISSRERGLLRLFRNVAPNQRLKLTARVGY